MSVRIHHTNTYICTIYPHVYVTHTTRILHVPIRLYYVHSHTLRHTNTHTHTYHVNTHMYYVQTYVCTKHFKISKHNTYMSYTHVHTYTYQYVRTYPHTFIYFPPPTLMILNVRISTSGYPVPRSGDSSSVINRPRPLRPQPPP